MGFGNLCFLHLSKGAWGDVGGTCAKNIHRGVGVGVHIGLPGEDTALDSLEFRVQGFGLWGSGFIVYAAFKVWGLRV